MNGLRSRFVAHVQSARLKGYVELSSTSRAMARAECTGVFRKLVVTLWERSEDGFGYFKIGVISVPANAVTVEASKS